MCTTSTINSALYTAIYAVENLPRGHVHQERQWTRGEAAEILRKTNCGGSLAFAMAAEILETTPDDIASPFLFAEQIRAAIARDESNWGCGSPWPCIPSADECGVYFGWGRTQVAMLWPLRGQMDRPIPATDKFRIHIIVPLDERDTHQRIIELREFCESADAFIP